ncbi:MAG: enoyl-CoA hydratase/isomerase family protein [Acidimicrobiales bacterium]
MGSDITPERTGGVLVDLHDGLTDPGDAAKDARASLPFVVVGVRHGKVANRWLDLCDVVVDAGDASLDRITEHVSTNPIAATTLALLLRGQQSLSVGDGLVAESAAYSVLQSGPEFAAWRATRAARTDRDAGPRVRTGRKGATFSITLTRPDRLNALDAAMRDELVEALTLAAATSEVTRVELHGEGRAFCAGGDLDEFGSRSDPATAHIVRLQRSVARTISRLGKPSATYVHGACMGSGIELAAFTDRVVAADDTQIALPEIGLGLVPGAGGTVSLTHRIGRLRTAWLAFSAQTIDAATALDWGLVDELVD